MDPNQNQNQPQTSDNPEFKSMDGRNITTSDTVPTTSDADLNSFISNLTGNKEVISANAGVEATITEPVVNRAGDKKPEETTQPSAETVPESSNEIEEFKKIFLKTQETEDQQQDQEGKQQTQQPVEAEEINFEEREQAYLERIKQLETQLIAWEEFKKDPGEFLSRNFPGFMKESFDPLLYVKGKMEEQGWGDFSPDPQEAFIIGTPSWKYVQDQHRFLQEAESIKNKTIETELEAQQKLQGMIKEIKNKAMQKYKMPEETFEKVVWSQIEQMDGSRAIELLVDAVMAIEELKRVKANIRQQADRSKIPPSVLDIGSNQNTATDEETRKLVSLFPSRFNL